MLEIVEHGIEERVEQSDNPVLSIFAAAWLQKVLDSECIQDELRLFHPSISAASNWLDGDSTGMPYTSIPNKPVTAALGPPVLVRTRCASVWSGAADRTATIHWSKRCRDLCLIHLVS